MVIDAPIDDYAVYKDAVSGRNTTGALSYADNDRFRPSKLGPDAAEDSRRRAWRSGRESRMESQPNPVRGRKWKPTRLLDWTLLAIEITGALVVAWLAWQYLYTVYFDTAPRRVPAQRSGSALNGTPTVAPSATPTRVSELVPPLVGDPGDTSGGDSDRGSADRSRLATATATPTVEPRLLLPSRLRIPTMVLDSPVHEVTVNMGVWEVSPMDIGHHQGTANPGEIGNVVLAGHRDVNSALFRELDRLQPGDELFVSNGLREYRYVVKESFVVSPDQIEVMEPTSDKRVTLITCTPIGIATQRLVVTAILDE